MTEGAGERRLVAVMSADAAGYSRLMNLDERATLGQLDVCRGIFRAGVEARQGRIVDTAGDSVLATFPSVVEAVACALEVQSEIDGLDRDRDADRRMRFRIGINLGDVITKPDGTIYGDGVNVAARLEGLAEPGGVVVSGTVHDQIEGRLDATFQFIGEREVKNIAKPVQAFSHEPNNQATARPADRPMLERPAVAVLPFANMSGDAEQEYFADGLSEDIITALSLGQMFPVIARNSTFVFKDRSVDVRQAAADLGARYVLEGSVRKAGNRVRVTGQLIDAETGHHIWAERFDRQIEDFFDLQDEITARIVATIEPELQKAEQKRSLAKKPSSLAVWDYLQRGMAHLAAFTKDGNSQARDMFDQALALDPSYAQAHAALSYAHTRDLLLEFADDREAAVASALDHARRAVALDDGDYFTHLMSAIAHMWPGDFDRAVAEADRAVQLNPNSAFARGILGTALDNNGDSARGIAELEAGLKLNPRDPQNHIFINTLARAYLNMRDYEAALAAAQRAVEVRPDYPHAHYLAAASLGHLGRIDEARAAIAECERLQPEFVARRQNWQPYRKDEDNTHIHDGVRRAEDRKSLN